MQQTYLKNLISKNASLNIKYCFEEAEKNSNKLPIKSRLIYSLTDYDTYNFLEELSYNFYFLIFLYSFA